MRVESYSPIVCLTPWATPSNGVGTLISHSTHLFEPPNTYSGCIHPIALRLIHIKSLTLGRLEFFKRGTVGSVSLPPTGADLQGFDHLHNFSNSPLWLRFLSSTIGNPGWFLQTHLNGQTVWFIQYLASFLSLFFDPILEPFALFSRTKTVFFFF